MLHMSASEWVSEQPQKKKIAAIRKTIKKPHELDAEDEFKVDNEEEERNTRVASVLEKMTSMNVAIDEAGSGLANFQPLDYPENQQQQKREPVQSNLQRPLFPPIGNGKVPTQYASPTSPYLVEQSSDYNKSYQIPRNLSPTSSTARSEDKIYDRLGYIVHLLERQQDEKTDNMTEEYVLYILLGTFVIFVIDSFSRSARYIR